MKKYLVVALALVAFIGATAALLTLVGSVTREPSVIVADTSCAPPCWNRITLGESTYDDVLSMIFRTERIDSDLMSETYSGGQVAHVWWRFTYPVPDSNGRVFFIDEKVVAILIGTYGSVTLEDVFSRLGQPSAVWTHCTTEAELLWTQTVLLWPDEGYAVVLDHDPPCPAPEPLQLTANDRVAQVIYFEPTTLREVLREHSLFGPDSEGAIDEAGPWSPAELVP